MENKIKMIHDQHVHTSFSKDSNQDMEEYINLAIANNCSYFVMTDHLDINFHNSNEDWIADYKEEKKYIKAIQEKYPNIKILQGIEYGYKMNENDRNKALKIVNSLPFDLINLSIHDYYDIDFYMIADFKKNGINETMNLYFKAMLQAVKEEDFDVLSHIDYGFKTIYQNDKTLKIESYEDSLREVLKVLIERKKTLEINTKVQNTINNNNHLRYLLRLYKSLGGVDLTISSDAHIKKYYMYKFNKYIKIIKEEGFDRLCYFINREKHYYNI